MIKYVDAQVVFSEIPGEITLAINISNCWFHCPKCHSTWLWQDSGKPLTMEALDSLIKKNEEGLTCVCFMGEGAYEQKYINARARYVKIHYPKLKVGLYTGRAVIPPHLDLRYFDYVKIGPYDENKGPINKPTTNQRLYKVVREQCTDITYLFWKHKNKEQ
jgi:anaerobic ribonucleoside-triphosphate reductase activating protein